MISDVDTRPPFGVLRKDSDLEPSLQNPTPHRNTAETGRLHAYDSTVTTYVAERLAPAPAGDTEIEIDFSGTSWEVLGVVVMTGLI